MSLRQVPASENQLVLLYALGKLDSATEMELNQFMTEEGVMNYFSLEMALSELDVQNAIRYDAHPLGEMLSLTHEGQYLLDTFLTRIPPSMRRKLDAACPVWKERFHREQQSPVAAYVQKDGRTCVQLKLLEGGMTLLSIMLVMDQRPTFLQERWFLASREIYEAVSRALTETESGLPFPEEAAIFPSEGGEWLLCLRSPGETPDFAVILSWPIREDLQAWARAWPLQRDRMKMEILRLLEGVHPDSGHFQDTQT